MDIYLVGGTLRDELLGRPVHDRDYTILHGDETELRLRFPEAVRVGGRACVYIIRGDEYTLSPARSIMEDLETRDLTINALAKTPEGKIIGPDRALEDLRAKVLRPVRKQNFLDDPLRAIRAARFAAWFPEFEVHPSLIEAMALVGRSSLLQNVAAERVGREVLKAGQGTRPSRFLELLNETGLLTPWFPEVLGADAVPAGPAPFHDGSLLGHIADVMDRAAPEPELVWMALCHDLGKAKTDSNKWPSHHHHERLGAPLAEALGRRLRLPARYIRLGIIAAREHMTAGMYPVLRPGTRVDLLDRLGRNETDVTALFRLVQADSDNDYLNAALKDLTIVKNVRLPEKYRNMGAESGRMLRLLRCQAVKEGQKCKGLRVKG